MYPDSVLTLLTSTDISASVNCSPNALKIDLKSPKVSPLGQLNPASPTSTLTSFYKFALGDKKLYQIEIFR